MSHLPAATVSDMSEASARTRAAKMARVQAADRLVRLEMPWQEIRRVTKIHNAAELETLRKGLGVNRG